MFLKTTQDSFFDRTRKYLVQKPYAEGGYTPFYAGKSSGRGGWNRKFLHLRSDSQLTHL